MDLEYKSRCEKTASIATKPYVLYCAGESAVGVKASGLILQIQ